MTKSSILLLSVLAFSKCETDAQSNTVDHDRIIETAYEANIEDSTLVDGWYYLLDTDDAFIRVLDKTDELYKIDPKPIVTKENFKMTEIFETDFGGIHEDYIGLKIVLDEQGAVEWAEATKKSIGGRLGLIIDNRLVNAPIVNAEITGGMTALNRTEYSREELEQFEKRIKK